MEQLYFCFDDISEQEYQIPLKKAAMIFKEVSSQTDVKMIQFNPQENVQQPTNNTFEYLFVSSDQIVAINPTTGKTTTRMVKQIENNSTFDVEETEKIKTPQTAMKEAAKQCGSKHARVKSWSLLAKSGKLYYKVKLVEKEKNYILLIRA